MGDTEDKEYARKMLAHVRDSLSEELSGGRGGAPPMEPMSVGNSYWTDIHFNKFYAGGDDERWQEQEKAYEKRWQVQRTVNMMLYAAIIIMAATDVVLSFL